MPHHNKSTNLCITAITFIIIVVIISCSKNSDKPAPPGSNNPGGITDTTGTRDRKVQVSCKLVDNAGYPLPELYVKIASSGSVPGDFQAESDSSGLISTDIYINTSYILKVYGAKDCISPIFTKSFSTTTKDTSLGNLTITGVTMARVTGTVVDCNNNPVTSGYIVMQRDTKDHQYKLSSAGTFNFSTSLCDVASSAMIIIVGQDLATIQTGYPMSVNVSAGGNNVGNLKACFDRSTDLQFLSYIVDDTIYRSYIAPANTISQSVNPTGNYMYISGGAGITFFAYGIAEGSSQKLQEFISPEVSGSIGPLELPVNVRITEYGAIGGYISGNFTGQVQQHFDNSPPRKVTCSFRVKRSE